ncbi:MAG: nucleoside transporter [Pseudomonadota bacterium]
MNEFDRQPLPPSALKPGRYFAASYAGEHVAGTEFVIGALFVAWGVGARDVIVGLAIGNTLAVLTWVIICAPIAVSTRLTLYAYLEKIAGERFVKLYSMVNGTLFCVLAGAMITVSASAVRILFGISPQVEWFPTSFGFVAIALAVGAVVTVAAMKGFGFVARFAEVSAPWMIAMFLVGGCLLIPVLIDATPSVDAIGGLGDFLLLAEDGIWTDRGTDMGIGHVIAIAWGANLAFHGALGDMTILRFAKHGSYAWYSALGMFIGHFGAWLAAGVMGAGAAVLLKTELVSLDAGEVAFQALGPVGILAVIIAGWTTSNPTIYRAGLAFQSLNPNWSRERVTLVVGAVTTVIACFPFVFTGLLNFLGLMALVLAPTGGIIVAEHHVLPRLGKRRYWATSAGGSLNVAALASWLLALAAAAYLGFVVGVHVLYLFVPAWIFGFLMYGALAWRMAPDAVQDTTEELTSSVDGANLPHPQTSSAMSHYLQIGAGLALAASVAIGVAGVVGMTRPSAHIFLMWSTGAYFALAVSVMFTGPRSDSESA